MRFYINKNVYKLLAILIVGFFGLCISCYSNKTFAQTPLTEQVDSSEQSCEKGQTPYSARYQESSEIYEVYVKLGIREQSAPVDIYFQSLSLGSCEKIGQIEANGETWQKIGDLNSANQAGVLSLYSPAITGLPDANRPTIMLISKNNPVCHPEKDCIVNIDGQQGAVISAGTLLNEDTLRVVKVVNPDQDTIDVVDYFVDFKPVYSKPSLEPFNLRYVSAGKHTLNTVINYASGQKILIPERIDRGYANEPTYLFYSFVYGQQTLLKAITVIFILVLLVWIVLIASRAIHRHYIWTSQHFLNTKHTVDREVDTNTDQPVAPHYLLEESVVKKMIKFGAYILVLVGVAIAVISFVNAFMLRIYQVDGPSMQNSLYSGENLAVNKLGKTWASVSNKKYLPKRGEIIVFKKATNEAFLMAGQDQDIVVKRVIGLPGERVTVNNGLITVFSTDYPNGFKPDENMHWSKNIQKSEDDKIDITLGPEEIFVVGDNRPESVDSRSFGAVKLDQIIGKVEFRIIPFDLANRL